MTSLEQETGGHRPLAGRGALVTGGSRGIGAAIVKRLARDGAEVVFSYASDLTAAKDVVHEVESAGGSAHPVQADVSDLDQITALFEAADSLLDGLDVVVNNAGVPETRLIEATTPERYDHVMGVIARGGFFVIQHAGRQIRDGGRIVSISTIGTGYPNPGKAVYTAGKAAVDQFVRVAARELGGRGVTANIVSPGLTDTALLRDSASAEAIEGAAKMTALGRNGRPDDIADVVAFLAGPDSHWVTGEDIRASGGLG